PVRGRAHVRSSHLSPNSRQPRGRPYLRRMRRELIAAEEGIGMVDYAKPLPIPDAESGPFWNGCRDGKLLAQRCRQCGRWHWPPSSVCPGCQSWDSEWTPLTGQGKIETFAVPHRAFHKGFAEEVPYVIAHVTMDGTDDNVRIIA